MNVKAYTEGREQSLPFPAILRDRGLRCFRVTAPTALDQVHDSINRRWRRNLGVPGSGHMLFGHSTANLIHDAKNSIDWRYKVLGYHGRIHSRLEVGNYIPMYTTFTMNGTNFCCVDAMYRLVTKYVGKPKSKRSRTSVPGASVIMAYDPVKLHKNLCDPHRSIVMQLGQQERIGPWLSKELARGGDTYGKIKEPFLFPGDSGENPSGAADVTELLLPEVRLATGYLRAKLAADEGDHQPVQQHDGNEVQRKQPAAEEAPQLPNQRRLFPPGL